MKALVAATLIVASLPVAAVPAFAGDKAERKICERFETKTGSHMGMRRICMTRAQWVEKLGPDWQARVRGYDPEQDLADLDMNSKDFEPPVVMQPPPQASIPQ